MTDYTDKDEPVYPYLHGSCQRINETEYYDGITLVQHAAIKLKVPRSGLDWLDEMIIESRRMDYAGQALGGWMANPYISPQTGPMVNCPDEIVAKCCDDAAAAMIAENVKGGDHD